MKLNLGCGTNLLPDYVNVDKAWLERDDYLQFDLEDGTSWPWEANSISEVCFIHSLEHMGSTVDHFKFIIQNLYRVCAPNAIIKIHVPHPRHDDFINDPTHVRIITPEILSLFSKQNCKRWREQGASNSQLADYWNVDFEIVKVELIKDTRLDYITDDKQIRHMLMTSNNVIKEYRIEMKCIK